MLVCTTIIESGLDIPNANTICHRAGRPARALPQLHQLRGRVGRGRERGYAYFLYPPEKPLTETAHDRLASDRGVHRPGRRASRSPCGTWRSAARATCSARSSRGHIAAVGFDLYLRLVGEAVADFRGEDIQPEPEMKIELPVEAHLPVDYVESERLRLEMYKRLAQVADDAGVDAVADELIDRYGPLPAAAEALLAVARFRLLARAKGITEIIMAGAAVRVSPAELPDSKQLRLTRLYPGSQVRRTAGHVLIPRPTTRPIAGQPIVDEELLKWATNVLQEIF